MSHKVFNIKLQNNEGSLVITKVRGKFQEIVAACIQWISSPYIFQDISVFPLLHYNCLSSSSLDTVFMNEANFLAVWLEGFIYGKIWALNCTLAKKNPIIPWSRTLFRIIRHIFTMPIKKNWDGTRPFLCCLPSVCSICCYICLWFSSFHTLRK